MTRAGVGAACAALLLGGLVLLPAEAASAHAYLVGSDPKAGGTVATTDRVTLQFDESLLDLHTDAVTVTDASGRHFETACPSVRGANVVTTVALGAAGRYTATWRVVSADGHVVSDSIAFRTTRDGGGRGRAAGLSCGGGRLVPAPAQQSQQPVVVIAIVVAAVVLLAVLIAVLVVAVRLRRPGAAAESADAPSDDVP